MAEYPDPHFDEDDTCNCPDHRAMRAARQIPAASMTFKIGDLEIPVVIGALPDGLLPVAQHKQYVFSGPDADAMIGLIASMAEFIAGPGLPGFGAWLDQEDPHNKHCSCNDPASHNANTRRHAENLAQTLRATLAE